MRKLALAGIVALGALACATSMQQSAQSGTPTGAPRTPAEQARADSGRMPFTAADVHFMQGMIHHHAQAVVMAGWAQTHGARPDVKTLAQRIDVAQRDEMAFMQRWLRERHQDAPDAARALPDGHGMACPPSGPDARNAHRRADEGSSMRPAAPTSTASSSPT